MHVQRITEKSIYLVYLQHENGWLLMQNSYAALY